MNTIEKTMVRVFEKDKYNRDLYGMGLIIGMTIKQYLDKDTDGFTRSDFLKGINEGLSKSDEDIGKKK